MKHGFTAGARASLALCAALSACGGPRNRDAGSAAPAPVRAEVVNEVEVADASAQADEIPSEPAHDAGLRADAAPSANRSVDDPCQRADNPCDELPTRGVSEVSRVIQAARSKFRDCYNAERKTRPNLTARLSIRIIIGRGGNVTSATEQSSTAPDPALAACVLDATRKLSFEPASNETTVQVPLNFVPPTP
jgi:outer membrane biosynthesis protein TonB